MACIWILIGDRYGWLTQHLGLVAIVVAAYFGPLVFLAVLEANRRKFKAR